MNPKYPPATIQIDVYYYFEDENETICVFDEDEMRNQFEKTLEELKKNYGK